MRASSAYYSAGHAIGGSIEELITLLRMRRQEYPPAANQAENPPGIIDR